MTLEEFVNTADLDWYGSVYNDLGIIERIFINNDPPEKVVDRIITDYNLITT